MADNTNNIYVSPAVKFNTYQEGTVATALVFSLDNDSDVIAFTKDGKKVGGDVVVRAQVTKNGELQEVEKNDKGEDGIGLTSPFERIDEATNTARYTYEWVSAEKAWKLTISSVPAGFTEGIFTFNYNGVIEQFKLRAIESTVDYNLIFDKTLINRSNGSGTIKLQIQKTESGKAPVFIKLTGKQSVAPNTVIETAEEDLMAILSLPKGNISLSSDEDNTACTISYTSSTSPFTCTLTGSNGMVWDTEDIEFIENGQDSSIWQIYLDNEEDTIVYTKDGKKIGKDTIVNIKLLLNDESMVLESQKLQITLPDSTNDGTILNNTNSFTVASGEWEDKISFKGIGTKNGTLTITGVPDGFEKGSILISYTVNDTTTLSKQFHIKTITSNVDYNLVIDETLVNISEAKIDESGYATIPIKIYETTPDGSTIVHTTASDSFRSKNIDVWIDDGTDLGYRRKWLTGNQSNWKIYFTPNETTQPISLYLCNISDEDADNSEFQWDSQTITFIQNGQDGQPGEQGNGIKSITEEYLCTNTNEAPKGTEEEKWSGDFPTLSESTPYVWCKETVKYDNGNSKVFIRLMFKYSKDGENGEAWQLLLDNDEDVVVYTKSGKLLTSLPSVTATVLKNGAAVTAPVLTVFTPEGNDVTKLRVTDTWAGKCFFNETTSTLTIKSLPEDFVSGYFTFQYTNDKGAILSTKFHLSTRSSDVDYNLFLDETLIKYSSSDGEKQIPFEIHEVNQDGTVTVYKDAKDWTALTQKHIHLWIGTNWKADDFTVKTKIFDKPVCLTLYETDNEWNSQTAPDADDFKWDSQTINFIKDGQDGQNGQNGQNGEDGISIKEIINYYAVSANNSEVTFLQKWDSNPKPSSSDFFRAYTEITYNNKTELKKLNLPNISTASARQVNLEYSTNNSLTTPPALGYQSTLPDISSNCYLWIRLYQSTGSIAHTCLGNFSSTPTITNYYVLKDSTDDYEWSITPSPTTPDKKYLWNCEEIVFSDGSIQIVEPRIISTHGEQGDKGDKGDSGTSPYLISLDNDSATIGTNASGGGYSITTLMKVSMVTVSVFEGTKDITSSCKYKWTVYEGTLSTLTDDYGDVTQNSLRHMSSNTATMTVTVQKDKTTIGSKTFTISKNKQGVTGDTGAAGAPAVTYRLIVSPNSFNTNDNDSVKPTFTVVKYSDDTTTSIPSGDFVNNNITIKYVNNGVDTTITNFENYSISATTTFDLYVGTTKWDSETVVALSNGKDGDELTAIPQTITVYGCGSAWNKPPAIPTDGVLGEWYLEKRLTTQTGLTDDELIPDINITVSRTIASLTFGSLSNKTYDWDVEILEYTSKDSTSPVLQQSYVSKAVIKVVGSNAWLTRNVYTYLKLKIILKQENSIIGEYIYNTYSQPSDFLFCCSVIQTTKNGTVTYSDWGEPELIKAYYGSIDPVTRATFLKLTEGGTISTLYQQNGNLYINADYIHSGAFSVGDVDTPIFTADVSQGKVSIGGWTVTQTDLYNSYVIGTQTKYFGMSSRKESSGIGVVFYAGSYAANDHSSATFRVLNDGALYCSNAHITGDVTANSGLFGGGGNYNGWAVIGGALHSQNYDVGLISDGVGVIKSDVVKGYIRIYAGKDKNITDILSFIDSGTSTNLSFDAIANFYVTNTGFLYCNNAYISGHIEAGSGKIGGWTISGDYFKSEAGTKGLYFFSDGTGTAAKSSAIGQMMGKEITNLIMRAGKTGEGAVFGIDDKGTLYATNAHITGTVNAQLGSFGATTNKFNIGISSDTKTSNAIYSRQNYFAGMGPLGSIQNNAVYIGGDGISMWLDSDPKIDYCTSIRPGVILCCGDAGLLGTNHRGISISSSSIRFWYGGTKNLRENTGTVKGEMVVTSTGVTLSGNFKGDTSGSIISDKNKKNSIDALSVKYNVLFDKLHPVKYKYNYGTSDRFHTGFIAQDVLQAINNSGLTTQDFAAYVETTDLDEKITLALRYEEFVALNTWQIQLLKPRMTAAEEEIILLKSEIAELRQVIENLQNNENSDII